MEHITSIDVTENNQSAKKGGAKKKSKKTKEPVDSVNNMVSDIFLTDVVEDFKDKVSLYPSNGLVNGDAADHRENEVKPSAEQDSRGSPRESNARSELGQPHERLEGAAEDICESEPSIESKVELSNLEAGVLQVPSQMPGECSDCKEAQCSTPGFIEFESYKSELQMAEIMRLIQKDLSEPYSIYTYRYFIHHWPKLCFLAMHNGRCIGAIVCKLDLHRKKVKRGYIAMLAVDEKYRKRKIGSYLVKQAIMVMISDDADEVVLETEITNKPALRLYENLGFVRDKRLFRYYLNGVDALRLKLWLR